MDNKFIVFYYKHFILPIVMRHVKKSDHFIDIGCAGGVLLTLLRGEGFQNLYGIDAAQVLLDRVPDKTIPTVCGNYLNVKQFYSKNQFDAATVFNTLHHLDSKEEYCQFFENLHYIMKPGSVVIIKDLYDGLFYKTYNAILHSKIARQVFPRVFVGRDFVQTHETDMHRRFFREFVPHFNKMVETQERFKIIKKHWPLTFEQLIVLKTI
ncbi:MAG: methyltransferase domain-containing protein [Candidatus Brocadiaceae bacterium]|nr:methyltransferase domain-containing protein [Candidatus Brocadiaceae bacterium]